MTCAQQMLDSGQSVKIHSRHSAVFKHKKVVRQPEAGKYALCKPIFFVLHYSFSRSQTISPEVFATVKEPDLVIVENEGTVIELFEPTCAERKLGACQNISENILN